MKKLNKYNRIATYLNKLYDMLNADFFDGELERPVITIQSTPRAYGHITTFDAWTLDGEKGERELNIGAGTLNRPIENVAATMLHEMCHQYNQDNNIYDTSRGGTYHNKFFKATAEMHGLKIDRSEKYGWTITNPADELLDWILLNELTDIDMHRNEWSGIVIAGGDKAANGGAIATTPPVKGNSRRYQCPSCKTIVRATKDVNIICGDCNETMLLTR